MSEEKNLIDRICDFISEVDAELGVEKAYIFGSTAKGKRLKESDVDIIIVSKSFKKMPLLKRLGKLQRLWRHREELQALTYTPEEFEKAKDRLMMQEILSYAVELAPSTTPYPPSS